LWMVVRPPKRMSQRRKRGRPPDDPEHGAMTGAERKRRWKQRQKERLREPDFRSVHHAPIYIEGSGGLTAHVGTSERIERRERERQRQAHDLNLDLEPAKRLYAEIEAHAAGHPTRWAKKRGNNGGWVRRAIPERSDQFPISPAEMAFPDGEHTRLREPARLELLRHHPQLRLESWSVQAVATELDTGARRRDEFSPFLTAIDRDGNSLLYSALLRLAVLGVLHIERVSDTNIYSLRRVK
jgi:hypothetical protein